MVYRMRLSKDSKAQLVRLSKLLLRNTKSTARRTTSLSTHISSQNQIIYALPYHSEHQDPSSCSCECPKHFPSPKLEPLNTSPLRPQDSHVPRDEVRILLTASLIFFQSLDLHYPRFNHRTPSHPASIFYSVQRLLCKVAFPKKQETHHGEKRSQALLPLSQTSRCFIQCLISQYMEQ